MNFLRRLAQQTNNPTSSTRLPLPREEPRERPDDEDHCVTSEASCVPSVVHATFDEHADEELIFLWSVASGAGVEDGRVDALCAFFDAFAEVYAGWEPKLDVSSHTVDVGCARAHPGEVTAAALETVANLPATLERALIGSLDAGARERRHRMLGIEIFRGLEVIAKSPHNRVFMEQLEASKTLASACKACSQHLLTMSAAADSAPGAVRNEAEVMMNALQRIISSIVNVIACFVDDSWALRSFNESGALLGVLEVLRVEKIVATRSLGDSRFIAIDIQCAASVCISRVMDKDVAIQRSLAAAGGLDMFFKGVFPRDVDVDAGLLASCLMSLEMSVSVLKGSKSHIERATGMGMFDQLTRLIRRANELSEDHDDAARTKSPVSVIFGARGCKSTLDSALFSDDTVDESEVLGEVFRTLMQVVEFNMDDDEDSGRASQEAREILLQYTLGSVVESCSSVYSQFADEVSCLRIRLYAINFLSRCLDLDASIIHALRKVRLWDILLDVDTFGAIPSVINESDDAAHYDEGVSMLRRRVQTQTAALLLKVCRISANTSDCVAECNVLIGMVTSRAMQPSIVVRFCRVLELLLLDSSHSTSKALSEIEAPGRLAGALSAQLKCWGGDEVSDVEQEGARPVSVAIGSTLSALSACLNGPDVLAVSALNNDGVPDLILNELLWARSTRDFAISATISLIGRRVHGPSTHVTSAQREAWTTLIRRFIQALPRARSSDLELLTGMMSGLRQMLNNPNGSGAGLRDWISAEDGADFVQIVALCDGDAGEQVALDVIGTVRAFISDSFSAAATFEVAVGYDTFMDAIQCARGTNTLSKPLFDALMSFAIDGEYHLERASRDIALRNSKALAILLSFFTRLDATDELRDEFIAALRLMLSSSVTSKATADAAGVLDFLIQLYSTDDTRRQAVLELIGYCSTFSLSTKHVRRVFEVLQGESVGTDDKMQILRILQNSAKRYGPSTFFDFTGPGCGIHVNKNLILSSRNGYTVSMWFRIEKFPDSGAPIPLFTMMSGSGNGILAEVQAHRLTLGIRGSVGVVETVSIDFNLLENEWTFFTLVHLPVRMSQPIVRVFIGADMVAQSKLRFPVKSTESFSHCRIASVTFDTSLKDPHVKVAPFFGQLGSTHIFDDAISQPAIAIIHALGSEYAGRFKSTESQTERILAAVGMSAIEARDTRDYLAEHCILNINAITEGGRMSQLLDLHGSNEYDMIGGAKVCVTRSARDVVHCLGGVQVVLPIFSEVVKHVEESRRAELVCEGICLLISLLDGNRLNQFTLTSIDGYALIANLLRENASTLLSPDLLTALDRLRRAAGIENESVSARVVLDLHLWSMADAKTQKAHGEYLASLASQHAEGLRFHLPTSDLIDALELSPGESGSSRRRMLLDVLKILVMSAHVQVVEETVETIVSVIEDCADEDVVGDVLRWLVNCMQPGESLQAAFYQSFTRHGGPLLVLSPLSRSSKRVRSFALLWLATLMPPLETPMSASSHLSAAFGAAAGALTATLGAKLTPTTGQDFEIGFFTAIANALEQFPLDIAESRPALFELLLGGQALPAEKVAEKLEISRSSSLRAAAGRLFSKVQRQSDPLRDKGLNEVGVPGIVNAGAAGVLLRLMNVCDDPEMRLSVLELLLQLVEGASVNAQAVLGQRGWQAWILPILRDDGDPIRSEERSMGCRLITALLAHSVLRTEDGHRHVSNTLGVVDILIKRGVLADDSNLALALLTDLLSLVIPSRSSANDQEDWSEVNSVESPICRRNLAKLLPIFDSIISDTASASAMLGVPNAASDVKAIDRLSWKFYDSLWNLLDIISPPGQALESAEEIKDTAKNANIAQKLHRRARSMMRDLPFSANREDDFDSIHSVEALREGCQGMGFKLALLYIRAGSLEGLESMMNKCTGLLPSFLAPFTVDSDAKSMDTTLMSNRAHLFIADLIRFVELGKASEDEDMRARVNIVSNLVRLSCEVGRFLLSDCESIEQSAHLDGRDLISEQKVAAAAVNEVKEARKVKELRAKVSENFLAERTRDEQRQVQAETALLETRKSKVTPVSERERARRAMQRLTFDERCDMLDRRWSSILHGLQGERGAWALGSSDATIHWKLDKSEDSAMRRARLKRDYSFTQYADNQKGGEQISISEVEDIQSVRLAGMGRKWNSMSADKELTEADDITDELAAKLAVDKEHAMHNKSKVIFSSGAILVTLTHTVPGKLNVSRDAIVFAADRTHESAKGHRKHFWRWSLSDIEQVHHMRYRLQHRAFEIHCSDRTSAFFAFDSKRAARYAASRVASAAGAVLMNRRAKAEAAERAKELWRRRLLSTFDYIMALNVFAGRTLHDLSQYPVFPWVLRDYDAESIDLNDVSVYRDLSKPVGALNDERLRSFVERFNSLLDDPDTPPFHYGSHYSSSPIVLYFLLRLEPFTKLARSLQGDRFDRADRLFHSIAETFKGCTESMADVKELIPEFYYSSEFLANSNDLRLGVRQDGARVSDVVLPAWAKGSRHEFTRIMREALESEYVSQNLHKWIDLIFGHAQRGEAAVERFNVFYYLTYEGAVDLDALEDEDQRKAIETQIINFGQTPTQIFRRPHTERSCCPPSEHIVSRSPESLSFATAVMPHTQSQTVVCIRSYGSSIATVTRDGFVSTYRLRTPGVNCTTGNMHGAAPYALDSESATVKRIDEFGSDSLATSQTVNIAIDGKLLLSVGHWDRSMRIFDVDEGRESQRISAHRDVTTCLATCERGNSRSWNESAQQMRQLIVVTGSRDTTLAVWEITVPQGGWGLSKGLSRVIKAEPRLICFGHDEAITCVDVCSKLNLAVSASVDGTLILHDIRDGRIVRALERPSNEAVPSSVALLSRSSLVVCACGSSGALSVHDVNGATLARTNNRHDAFESFRVTRDERHILTGNRRGDITVRTTHDLSVRSQINVANVGIAFMETVGRDECLLVGLVDGRTCFWAPALADRERTSM